MALLAWIGEEAVNVAKTHSALALPCPSLESYWPIVKRLDAFGEYMRDQDGQGDTLNIHRLVALQRLHLQGLRSLKDVLCDAWPVFCLHISVRFKSFGVHYQS